MNREKNPVERGKIKTQTERQNEELPEGKQRVTPMGGGEKMVARRWRRG